MSTNELVASLVGSLAWPIAATAAVILLRTQIRRLFDTLPTRVKAGPLEFEWDRRARDVTEALSDALDETGPTGPTDQRTAFPPSRPTQALNLARARVTADEVPVIAVVHAFRLVEHRLTEIAAANGMAVGPELGIDSLLAVTEAQGVVSPSTMRAIRGLTELRNTAAHDKGSGLSVTVPQAREYVALVEVVLRALEP